ncbi:MAG TPA: hypothetical protein VFR31_01900 [Thermoanaerobaculia bacterium]|nr:hypothetical protein [Thermoanaerobaculia bacterium]
MRQRMTKVCLVCFALVALMWLPGQASAQVPAAAPEMCSDSAEIPTELQHVFNSSWQPSCNTILCRTNADCAAVCPDVAKCCATPACQGGPSGGGWGYCVLM